MQTEDQLIADIKNLKIQGATNVAMAILNFLSLAPTELAKEIGERLAYVRPTEPLAQNAIRYICSSPDIKTNIAAYTSFIENAKKSIITHGAGVTHDGKTYLTHCHASTVTSALLAHKAHVIATETRPRFQGRTTAQELLDAGIDVTMIVDSAAASLIHDSHIAGMLVGADLLTSNGFVNKIGTYGIALAAQKHGVPIYCFSTLLKYGDNPVIENRDPKEIWPDAPNKLKFYAPAFDFTPYDAGVTLITEVGVVKGQDVLAAVKKEYPWLIPTKTI
ncbi:hypothetical protein A2363_03975 [Candidatus Gottesmanbacteria bacterium RIFOXYB1_FULL_47_11]|uniref:Uncharacterized protein n=1 Tax=Candidatus Gottesmanbacteria bacterium RIFOXYB1_FULL_47_11 TaxID=1798401 RepID=A0A1F6BCJ4_9BACT|nr:MAG: hypothetical protein A2363_03975 [Candidatus Gottesmanbacteria bacterium RIFOXYB1_FULL_47_11]